jgi:phosphoribosylamine--glycine ligase
MAGDAECVDIGAKDIEKQVDFALKNRIDYAVVAPDDPLVLGAVDALEAAGIPCFGPNRAAALIEGSKAFAKGLMNKYGIPTAAYYVFDDKKKAIAYIDRQTPPIVVKADGLALGKGVVIAADREEAKRAVVSMMEERRFGDSG